MPARKSLFFRPLSVSRNGIRSGLHVINYFDIMG